MSNITDGQVNLKTSEIVEEATEAAKMFALILRFKKWKYYQHIW